MSVVDVPHFLDSTQLPRVRPRFIFISRTLEHISHLTFCFQLAATFFYHHFGLIVSLFCTRTPDFVLIAPLTHLVFILGCYPLNKRSHRALNNY